MRYATVFDWAQVKLAEEWLNVLFKANAQKQHVVNQLANTGGVIVTWDGNGLVKLEGSWERILKSQTIFENYLKNLEDPEATRIENSDDLNLEHRSVLIDGARKEDSSPKSLDPTTNPATESNEVYVNITLSGNEMSDLNNESIPVVNNIHPNVIESCDRSSEKINGNCHVIECGGNSFEHNFIVQSESNCMSQSSGTGRKIKEDEYNVSEYHHNVLYSICNPQPGDTSLKESGNTKETMLPTSSFCEDVSNDVSRTIHPVERVISSENVPPLSTDITMEHDKTEYLDVKCQLENKAARCVSIDELNVTLDSNQIKQKYHKKKDYEELAPFKFFCSMCSFKSKRESHFTRHMKLHNEVSKLFKCCQCSFTSIRLSHLRRHELNHSKLTLACNLCQYRTNSQKLLVRHNRFKHAPEVTEVKKDILKCAHCEYQTSRSYFLQRHMKVHVIDASMVQVYQCEQCSYKTNRKEHFVRHTNNIHEGRRPYLCHWCGKAFKRQDALKQHSSTHTTQDAVTCPECGKGCRSHTHLSQHMSVHSSERLFLCELCGASFKTRAVQRKHMFTIHQHPKAFLCSHCSRKFSTKFALRRHVKQHSSQLSVEKTHQDQVSAPTIIPDTSTSMRLVAMDTVLYSDPMGSHPSALNVTTGTPKERAKLTFQSAATYKADSVRVIPAQTVMQPNSETTALVYLTRTFVPLQR